MTEHQGDLERIHGLLTEAIDNLMLIRRKCNDAKSFDASVLMNLHYNLCEVEGYSSDALDYAKEL